MNRGWIALAAAAAAACSKTNPAGKPSPAGTAASPAPPADSSAEPPPAVHETDHVATAKGDLAITPLHHASLLLQWDRNAIYVDPTGAALKDPTLPKADAIFITHLHRDHVDGEGLERVSAPRTVVVAPMVVADRTNVDVVISEGATQRVLGFAVTGVAMYNLARGPAEGKHFHERGQGEGFVFDFAGTRVYVSGDTECTPEVRALKHIDIAFVAVNLPYTMSPEDAAACVRAFKPRIVYPYHYSGARNSVEELTRLLSSSSSVEVRERRWY